MNLVPSQEAGDEVKKQAGNELKQEF